MESSHRDLLNDMTERRPIWKNNQNTYHPCLHFTPKTGIAFPKTGFCKVDTFPSRCVHVQEKCGLNSTFEGNLFCFKMILWEVFSTKKRRKMLIRKVKHFTAFVILGGYDDAGAKCHGKIEPRRTERNSRGPNVDSVAKRVAYLSSLV